MSDDFLRDLVEGERAHLVPAAGAKEKTWKRVSRSVAIAAPLPAISGPAAAVPRAAGWGGKAWWTTTWAKGVVVVLVGGAVLAGVLASRSDGDGGAAVVSTAAPEAIALAPVSEPEAASRGAVDEAELEVHLAPPEPAEPAPAASSLQGSASEVASAAPTSSKPRTAAPRDHDRGHEPPGDSTLAEEARLVVAARRDLKAGSPRAALGPLKEHARRFPHGQLTEERIALTARALCEAGDTEGGRRHAENLRAAFPSSSHLRRVDRACE